MQGELGHVLGNHRHHPGIMRPRGHFAENHLVALDEKLHAEDTVSSEGRGYFPCDMLGLGQCIRGHCLRLPRLPVVAVHLMVAYRLEECSPGTVADSQESDFIVKVDKALHNHFSAAGTASFLGNMPCPVDIGLRPEGALSVARGTHDRLYDAREAYFFHGCIELFPCGSEPVP